MTSNSASPVFVGHLYLSYVGKWDPASKLLVTMPEAEAEGVRAHGWYVRQGTRPTIVAQVGDMPVVYDPRFGTLPLEGLRIQQLQSVGIVRRYELRTASTSHRVWQFISSYTAMRLLEGKYDDDDSDRSDVFRWMARSSISGSGDFLREGMLDGFVISHQPSDDRRRQVHSQGGMLPEDSPRRFEGTTDQELARLTTMDWSHLSSVVIRTTSLGPYQDDVFWLFSFGSDGFCTVPSQAMPDDVLARLQSLPGFDNSSVISAMGCASDALFPCWDSGNEPGYS